MSFSSNKTKQKSQQSSTGTSTTTVDPWSKAQFENQTAQMMNTSQGILDRTQQYTNKPFKAYGGPMVADMSAGEQQAMSMAQAGSGAGGVLNDAVTAAKAGGSQTWTPEGVLGPDKVSYRTFDKTRVQDRMNPYISEVVDTTGAYYDEQLGKRMSENQARATQSGAYGGSRHGIADAELQRTSNMDRAQMMADLRYRGYNDAVAGDERETQGIFGADQYNSTAGYQARMNDAQRRDQAAQFGIQQKFNEAGILGSLAGQKDASFGQQAEMLAKYGATAREIDQAKLLAARAEFDRAAKDELDKLMLELQARQGVLSTQAGILGSTPMGNTTNSSGTGQSSGTTTSSGFKFAPTMSIGPMTFGGG
jgi:hypothetical protein